MKWHVKMPDNSSICMIVVMIILNLTTIFFRMYTIFYDYISSKVLPFSEFRIHSILLFTLAYITFILPAMNHRHEYLPNVFYLFVNQRFEEKKMYVCSLDHKNGMPNNLITIICLNKICSSMHFVC